MIQLYTWDRANRLLSMGGASYQYDGEGRRVQQTVGANVTKYLLDVQPGLAVVLAETTGANVIRNVHAPRGIHAHKDAGGAWEWMVQDGLGSVRGVVGNAVDVLESRNYDPYGVGFDATGTSQTDYGFTGEPADSNGLLYLRARYYNPAVGVFTALDPFEGMWDDPMSINGYSYVHGNPINFSDPSGKILPILIFAIAAAGSAGGVAAAWELFVNQKQGLVGHEERDIDWCSVGRSFVTGALVGGAAGLAVTSLPGLIGAVTSVGGSVLGGSYNHITNTQELIANG